MKSLQTLILSHILVSIFVTFFLVYGQVTRPFLIVFLLALPVLNKGQRSQKITSKKIRLLNASLCFILVSLPQLITNSMDWRYLLFLTIFIIFSSVYFYTLYQLFKEVKQKECYYRSKNKPLTLLRARGSFSSLNIVYTLLIRR